MTAPLTQTTVSAFLALKRLGVADEAAAAAMDATPPEAWPLWETAIRSAQENMMTSALAQTHRLADEEQRAQDDERVVSVETIRETALPAPEAGGKYHPGDFRSDEDDPPHLRKWRGAKGLIAPVWVEDEVARMLDDPRERAPVTAIHKRFGLAYGTIQRIVARRAARLQAEEERQARIRAGQAVPETDIEQQPRGRGIMIPAPTKEAAIRAAMQPGAVIGEVAIRFRISKNSLDNWVREERERRETEARLREAGAAAPAPTPPPPPPLPPAAPPATPAAGVVAMPDWAVKG